MQAGRHRRPWFARARATLFTHLLLHRRLGCDSLLDQHCLRGAGDDGAAIGAVWGPPLAKRGVFLLERLVESGGCGVRVRRLGRDRAGEMRITRFLRNPSVSVSEIVATAAGRTCGRVRGRHVLRSEEHTSELQSLMRTSSAVFCLKKK